MTPQNLAEFFARDELLEMFESVGDDVSINRSAVFFSPKRIRIGSNVRIDCFGLISAGEAGIDIGDHVHISTYVGIVGGGGRIVLEDFCGLASKSTLYTSTDDFSGGSMTGPTIPDKYRNVRGGDITIGRHAVVGCGSVVLPGVTIGLGATVGALSLVRKDVPDFAVVAGNPLRQLRQRGRQFLEQEKEFLAEKRAKG